MGTHSRLQTSLLSRQKMLFFYYFAYGSNLLKDRIQYRQKGAEYVCNGKLHDFSLVFVDFSRRWQGALASINQTKDVAVWGCVWRIPNEFSDSLDLQELGYHRLSVPIETPTGVINCRTYQFSAPSAALLPPSPHYKLVIVEGAKEHGLPKDYVQQLEGLPDNGYRGAVDVDIPLLKTLNSQPTVTTSTPTAEI